MKAEPSSSPKSDDDERPAAPPVARSRFAEAGARPPALDKVDVVLGEWANGRPKADLEPIAVTIRVSRLAQVLQQRMERASSRFGLDWGQFLVLAALRGRIAWGGAGGLRISLLFSLFSGKAPN